MLWRRGVRKSEGVRTGVMNRDLSRAGFRFESTVSMTSCSCSR